MSNIINFEFTRHLLNVLKTERFKGNKNERSSKYLKLDRHQTIMIS